MPGYRPRWPNVYPRHASDKEAIPILRITEPFHGAVLNHKHGAAEGEALRIAVEGTCPPNGRVWVNGEPARVVSGVFGAEVLLTARETDVVATYEGPFGRLTHSVRVVWDRHSFPRYRVSLDDNIFFLRDIAVRRYASLFDCHYLALLKRMNREYGTRFTCNVYYQSGDGFTLAEFPDCYRAEWDSCADWLGLTFHARADKPDRPYAYASAEQLLADYDLVEAEVKRFAGERSWIPPTIIHWGVVPQDSIRGLVERGVRVLSGYFSRERWGYDVHYWLDDARCEYLSTHDCLRDFDTGVTFSRVDMVINNTSVTEIPAVLGAIASDPDQSEIMDLITHEQYFWPFYEWYLPDHPERLETAIRWVTEHGYQPVFYHEGFLGAPE